MNSRSIWHATAAIGLVLAVPAPSYGQAALANSTEDEDPAALRQKAEAIDPLAKAAEAEAAWQAYLSVLEATDGPVEEQARALNRMGDSRYYQQNMDGALQASLEAERRLTEAGATGGEAMAETLSNMAAFYTGIGQPEKDVPLQERSLKLRVAMYGDDPSVLEPAQAKALGLGYLNYAVALYEAGRFGEAADYVDPAIAGMIRGEITDATLFVALSSGANVFVDAGRQVDALRLAQEGIAKANELLPEDHPFHGFAQATLAKVLLQSDRYEEAEEPARSALDIMTENFGPNHRHTLVALHNLGVIAMRLGHYDEGIELMLARQERLAEIDPGEAVNSLRSASNAALEAGRDDQALTLAEKAANISRNLPADDAKAIGGLLTLVRRLDEAGDYSAALSVMDELEQRSLDAGEPIPYDIAIQRGVLEIREGDQEAGWQRVANARDTLITQMVSDAESFELGADLDSYYETVMQIVEAAMVAGRAEDALNAFELASWGVNARAEQLINLRRDRAEDPAISARIDTLSNGTRRLRLLARERAAMLAAGRSDDATIAAEEIAELQRSVTQAREQLSEALPGFAESLRPAQLSLTELQSRLTDDEAVLIVMPARSQTFAMAISADTVAIAQTDGARSAIRPLVAQLRSALDNPAPSDPFPTGAAVRLHDLIMPPAIASVLSQRKNVAVVTSDALSRLPFASLLSAAPSAGTTDYQAMDWLVRKHAFSTSLMPSLAFAGTDEGAPAGSYLGVGAPQLSGSSQGIIDEAALYRGSALSLDDIRALPALPDSEDEVHRVGKASQLAKRVILTGAQATESGLRQLADTDFGIILFATHGLMEGEIGGLREPALVLTPPAEATGPENDGLLSASEIADLGLAARLVILSACNSSAGRNGTAPAYTGLANAFLSSGSESLMLSHWRVRDDVATELTVGMLEEAGPGRSYAEALQAAQLSMIDDTASDGALSHPALWAPMVILGN